MTPYFKPEALLASAALLLLCSGGAAAQAQDYSAFVYEAGAAAPAQAPETAQERLFEARGVLRAAQTAEIGAGMSARLIKVPLDAGQRFKRGALLAEFDCTQERAQAEAIKHALAALSVKYENVKELQGLGAAGTLEVSMARAETDRAQADLDVAHAKLKHCKVYAPYSGTIKTRYVSAYDTPPPGSPLFSIIRTAAPEIDLIAPSSWMRWMKPGDKFSFEIDETGETRKGKIVRFGASVDPVSQTIDVTAKFDGTSGAALPGMSGVARFTPVQKDKS